MVDKRIAPALRSSRATWSRRAPSGSRARSRKSEPERSEGQRFPRVAARSVEPVTEQAQRSSGRRVIERALEPRGAQGILAAARTAERSAMVLATFAETKVARPSREAAGETAFQREQQAYEKAAQCAASSTGPWFRVRFRAASARPDRKRGV